MLPGLPGQDQSDPSEPPDVPMHSSVFPNNVLLHVHQIGTVQRAFYDPLFFSDVRLLMHGSQRKYLYLPYVYPPPHNLQHTFLQPH